MIQPRTVTAEREAEIRSLAEFIKGEDHRGDLLSELFAEIDAWREAYTDLSNEMKLMIPLHEAVAEKDKAVDRERAAHQETQVKLAKEEYEDERKFIELLETESGADCNGSVGSGLVSWIRGTKTQLVETQDALSEACGYLGTLICALDGSSDLEEIRACLKKGAR